VEDVVAMRRCLVAMHLPLVFNTNRSGHAEQGPFVIILDKIISADKFIFSVKLMIMYFSGAKSVPNVARPRNRASAHRTWPCVSRAWLGICWVRTAARFTVVAGRRPQKPTSRRKRAAAARSQRAARSRRTIKTTTTMVIFLRHSLCHMLITHFMPDITSQAKLIRGVCDAN